VQGTKLKSLSYCEWDNYVSGNGLLCDSGQASEPEQHMNIEVCGSGFVLLSYGRALPCSAMSEL